MHELAFHSERGILRNLEPNIWPIPALLLLLELGAIRGNKWEGGGGRLTSRREEAEEREEGLNLPAINHRNFVVVALSAEERGSLLPATETFPVTIAASIWCLSRTIFFV